MRLAARLILSLAFSAVALTGTTSAAAAPFANPSVPYPWGGPPGALSAAGFSPDEYTTLWSVSRDRLERLAPDGSGALAAAATVVLPASVMPVGVAAGAGQVFVLDAAGEQVVVLQAGREVARMPVGSRPVSIAAALFVVGRELGVSLFVANAGSRDVSVYRRQPGRPFEPELRVPVGGEPRAVVVGHFGEAGDAAVAVASGTVLFLGQDGGVRNVIPVGQAPSALATAPAFDYEVSLDGDGNEDLVVALSDTVGRVVLGGKPPRLGPPVDFTGAGSGPWKLAIARYDADRRPDLAVAGARGVYVLRGVGQATFAPPVAVTKDAESVALVGGNFGRRLAAPILLSPTRPD